MMLNNHFFNIHNSIAEAGTINASISFNAEHPIFAGHFPGQPVVPGVTMVQLVKEVLEENIATKTRLTNASDIKFLSVITPQKDQLIQLELKLTANNNNTWTVTALLKNEATICFKFKGLFTGEVANI